ncbi:C4-dicarboxylate TRAP transporter substrate-binding protein [Paracoccus versutus]|uniref:TRAP-type C4-dicarboxylate transport system substrate-binding protein n=1 Tax=Paracoccus versutus TaxID=34007 RepID=A0A3D9XSM5_PARVE|nr:C4-dicarboxylate TRAP transporter substrate-binding protein [Paracoccus versutus]REF73346.1 TRAP-type C4-dicarboxylate transport system substrate-binding protein [Paracoccus versutus]
MTLKTPAGLGALICAATLCSLSAARAADYTYSTLLSPDHPQNVFGGPPWADGIREATNGEVDFQIFAGGVLLPGGEVLEGLSQGVADAAFVTAGYIPAQMPLWALIGDMGWIEPDMAIITMAATEFGILDEYGMRDWQDNNVVFGGDLSTGPYVFHCRGEPKTLADFKGLRIRTAGNGWARFAEYIGAVPVNLTFADIYSSLERGALDCAALDEAQIIEASRTGEVVDSIVALPMGPFFSQATWAFNEQFWSGLTAAQREAIFDQNAHIIAKYLVGMGETIQRNYDGGRDRGVTILEPADDLIAKAAEFVADDVGGLAAIAESRGVTDYQAALASFTELVEKWRGLLDGVDRTDEAALYDLARSEIFDKIDYETYRVE